MMNKSVEYIPYILISAYGSPDKYAPNKPDNILDIFIII